MANKENTTGSSTDLGLTNNWQKVLTQINKEATDAGMVQDSVQLLAVSKTKPASAVAALADAGQCHFGENYLQDALPKIEALTAYGSIVWHFIGHIQRNKTRDIAQNFDWVHTIERDIIAQRLNEQRPDHLAKLNVLIQVNIDEEESKSGCLPSELNALIECIKQYENLSLRGLMIIPAKATTSSSSEANAFVRTKALFDEIKNTHKGLTNWDTLSMGMSSDMAQAIKAGSTMVRVGTAIFGKRL